MQSLLERLQCDFESMMGALTVLPIELGLRDECGQLLKPPSATSKSQVRYAAMYSHSFRADILQNVLYSLLVSGSTLITLLRPKSHSIHPTDLHILLNTLSASSSLRAPGSESWLPICLPKFNAKGFVYAFISYFAPDESKDRTLPEGQASGLRLGVVLVTTDKEAFFAMKAWKDSIEQVGLNINAWKQC